MPDGGFPVPDWSPEAAIQSMSRLGVQTSMLSVSSPCVHFLDGRAAQSRARSVNEAGAELVADHDGRFGAFASLPLPGVEASVAELAYALDDLKLDGVILETNADGIHLGDERLEPVFAALNARGAAMLIHPTSPACYEQVAFGRPAPMIEFYFDTTRAVVNLIFPRTLDRYPDINIIVPHAGATLSALIPRLAMFADLGIISPRPPDGAAVLDELKRLYFDLAGSGHPALVTALTNWVPTSQILFGSDYPFTPETSIARYLENFECLGLSTEDVCAIEYRNALRLFPRLRALFPA